MDDSSHGALFLHTTLLSDSKNKNKTISNMTISNEANLRNQQRPGLFVNRAYTNESEK